VALIWLAPGADFPSVEQAATNGMLAVGGDYSWQRLHRAYTLGIFPWSNPDDPILWWSPDPRYVLYPEHLRIHRSMRPYINQRRFRVTYDTRFAEVVEACSQSPRQGKDVGTWISTELAQGYTELHRQGFAHSVEVWDAEGHLVGGLYGVAIGRVFCGESMFTRASNASKYGFIHLVKNLIARGYADVLGDSRSVRPQSPSTATDEPPKRKRKPRGPKPVESVTEVPVETPVEVTETEEPEAVESTEPATENPE